MVWIFSGFILPNQCMAWQIHSEESRTPSTPLLKGTAKIITEESGTLSTPHFQSKAKILSRIIWYTQYTNFSRPHRILL